MHYKQIDGKWNLRQHVKMISGMLKKTNKIIQKSTGHYFPSYRIHFLRQYPIVEIIYPLFRFNESEKKLYELKEMTLTFHCKLDSQKTAKTKTVDQLGLKRVSRVVENFSLNEKKLLNDSIKPAYVIIGHSAVIDYLKELDRFIKLKKKRGYNVIVVTDKDGRYGSGYGGGKGDIASERIRKWLKNNYIKRSIKYVLIIGNPDPINGYAPMKLLHPRKFVNDGEDEDGPSDYYYSELSDEWDKNQNGYYGEFDDYRSDYYNNYSGIDNYYDVIVGRIPFYLNTTEVDKILARTIDYQNARNNTQNQIWRKSTLLPMSTLEGGVSYGFYLGEEIDNKIIKTKTSPPLWPSPYKIYDSDGLPASVHPNKTDCTYSNVREAWAKKPYGLIIYFTHGDQDYAYNVFTISDIEKITKIHKANPAMIFSCSCSTMYPENRKNLGYTILKNTGIVYIGSTRVSWYTKRETEFYEPSIPGFAFKFTKMLIHEEMSAGEALHEAKQNFYYSSPETWMNCVTYNIYGDPELKILPTECIPDTIKEIELTYDNDNRELRISWEEVTNCNIKHYILNIYKWVKEDNKWLWTPFPEEILYKTSYELSTIDSDAKAFKFEILSYSADGILSKPFRSNWSLSP